jgi:hypothetical protein
MTTTAPKNAASATNARPPRYAEDMLVVQEFWRDKAIQPVVRNSLPEAHPATKRPDTATAAKNVQKIERRMKRLIETGAIAEAQQKARVAFSKCAPARVIAATRALRDYKPPRGQTKPSVAEVAGCIFRKSWSEYAYAKATPKSGNRLRVTIDLDLVDRARAHLVRIAFGPLITYADNQAGVPGAGPKQAIDRARAFTLDKRFKYVAEMDIQNCFGSVDVDQLRMRYGIPQWVLDCFVTTKRKEEEGKILPRNSYSRNEWNRITSIMGYALPQGSPASPLFAYGFLKPALEEFKLRFGDRVEVVNYCDNFLIFAPGVTSMESAREYLTLVLKKHSAERFVLEPRSDVRRVADGIDFLGYHFKRRNRHPVIDLPKGKKLEFKRCVREKLAEIDSPSGRVICDENTRLRNFANWMRGTLASFRFAPEAQFQAMWDARRIKRYRHHAVIADLMRWIASKAPSDEARRQNEFRASSPWDVTRFKPWLTVPAHLRVSRGEPLSAQVTAEAAAFVQSRPWQRLLAPSG